MTQREEALATHQAELIERIRQAKDALKRSVEKTSLMSPESRNDWLKTHIDEALTILG